MGKPRFLRPQRAWVGLGLAWLLVGCAGGYRTLGESVPLTQVPVTWHLRTIVMDSSLVRQTMDVLGAAWPNEAIVCVTVAVQESVVTARHVYPAVLDSATPWSAWWGSGPAWGCDTRRGFAGTVHSHTQAVGCEPAVHPSKRDIVSMHRDPRLLWIMVFCVDGTAAFTWRDGRHLWFRWLLTDPPPGGQHGSVAPPVGPVDCRLGRLALASRSPRAVLGGVGGGGVVGGGRQLGRGPNAVGGDAMRTRMMGVALGVLLSACTPTHPQPGARPTTPGPVVWVENNSLADVKIYDNRAGFRGVVPVGEARCLTLPAHHDSTYQLYADAGAYNTVWTWGFDPMGELGWRWSLHGTLRYNANLTPAWPCIPGAARR